MLPFDNLRWLHGCVCVCVCLCMCPSVCVNVCVRSSVPLSAVIGSESHMSTPSQRATMSSSPARILPSWAAAMPSNPSMSSTTRLDVFMSVDDPYETFATSKLITKTYMICDICTNVLRDPCTCKCTFVACAHCLQFCDADSCLQCRAKLPDELVPAKHYQNVLDAECQFQGVRFSCNTASPGSDHPCPLWCCNKSFDTLRELEEHLRKQGSFEDSRASASSFLQRVMATEPAQLEKLFLEAGEAVKLHAATLLEENNTWQMTGRPQRSGNRTRKRSRSIRRGFPPTPVGARDPLERAFETSLTMSEGMQHIRRHIDAVQRRFVFML